MRSPKSRPSKIKTPQSLLEILEQRILYSVHNDSFDVTQLTELRSDPAYSSITGKGVAIAVLDTGVDAQNPDLTSKVVAYYNAVEDAIPTAIDSSSVSSAVDNDGHGTHTSGIAASADPNIGVAYGASLVDVKVIADSGESQLSGDPLLRGLEFVQDFYSQFNIKVVSMSLGESTSSGGVNDNTVPAADDISREISLLQSLGITVVAAAGNSYANDPVPGESYPAVVSTISVASTWSDTGSGYDFNTYAYGSSTDSWAATESSATADQFSATSQRSTLPNQIVAPGVNIYSDWNGSSTDNSGSDLLHNTLSGTSMATPFVAGMVALMQQAALTYGGQYFTDPEQILTIIKETADVINDPTIAGDTRVPISDGSLTGGSAQTLPGTGDTYDRVNVYKAIQAVKALFSGAVSTADTNNTTATATVVPDLNGTAAYTESGVIGNDGLNDVGVNDVDVYKITLDETGSLTAALADTTGGTSFTAEVRLFNSSGGEISSAAGTSSAGYPTLTTSTASPLPAGVYYVAVSSAGNAAYSVIDGSNSTGGSTTGDYSLTLSLSNPDPNGVPSGAVSVDMTDPNYEFTNTRQVANLYNGTLGSDPSPSGGTTRVTVANGDVDMFKIVAPDTGTLTALADTSAYGFDGADTYTELLDSNYNVLASDGTASSFGGSNSQVEYNVAVGQTYYVAVTTYANRSFNAVNPYDRVTDSTATETNYDLYLSFNNGNTDGTALLANSARIGQAITGTIGSTDSTMGSDGGSKYVDWYTFTSASSGLIDLTATATTSGFSPNIQLWTLSSDGSSITEIGGITGSGQSLIDSITAGETVYVSVTGAGNSNFNWYSLGSGSGGSTGSYSLTSSLLSTSAVTTLNDNSIDYGTPETLTVGQAISGNIGSDAGLLVGDTDVDLYKFTPATSGAYDIRTDTSQEGSADTYLRLFDASGNQLSSNDNASSATTSSFIRADLEAGQTYYIGVSGTGNSTYSPVTGDNTTAGSTGNYVVSVTAATIPAITITSPAAVSPTTGGTNIDFTVSLDFAASTAVTINYATADGTALAGTDYTATSGTLTIAAGQTTATISVPVLVDTAATGTTTFTLNLSSPSTNATLDGGQATGTITNLPVTKYTFTSGQKAVFDDSTSHKVTVTLTGPGSGTVSVVGSAADLIEITATGTTAKSHLSISTTETTSTTINGLTVTGSLAALSAPKVELAGNLVVTGTIAALTLYGASGQNTLSIEGSGVNGLLELGNVSDLSVTTAEPLRELTAKAWTNLDTTDVITAPYIGLLNITGELGASLTVGAGGSALQTVHVGGAINNGTWSVNGSTGSVVAGSTAVAWVGNFNGSINALQVNGNASGTISASSIKSLHVRDNLSDASITLNSAGTGKTPALGVFSVSGTITDSVVRSAGSITSVHAGAINGSTIFAGVAAGITGLPSSVTDFATNAEITSVSVTGVHGSSTAFSNTDIAAAILGKVSVTKVDTAGTVPFGFAADSLASFSDTEPGTATVHYNSKTSKSVPVFSGDFRINLV